MNDPQCRHRRDAWSKRRRTNFAVRTVASNVFGLRFGLMAGTLQTSHSLVERGKDVLRIRKTAGAGHACRLEDPARVNENILEFLKGIVGGQFPRVTAIAGHPTLVT